MNALARCAGQAVLYAAFFGCIGYFSSAPAYHALAPGEALVRLTLTHAAQSREPCRRRTAEELAKLAPNMRAPLDCTRARADVAVELEIDGQLVTRVVAPPSGLAHDGPSTVYRRIVLPAGKHAFHARLSDNAERRFDHVAQRSVEIAPGRVLTIDFNPAAGGFVFVQ